MNVKGLIALLSFAGVVALSVMYVNDEAFAGPNPGAGSVAPSGSSSGSSTGSTSGTSTSGSSSGTSTSGSTASTGSSPPTYYSAPPTTTTTLAAPTYTGPRDSTQLVSQPGVSTSTTYVTVYHWQLTNVSQPGTPCPAGGQLKDSIAGQAWVTYHITGYPTVQHQNSLYWYVYYSCQEAYTSGTNTYYTSTLVNNTSTACADNNAYTCSYQHPPLPLVNLQFWLPAQVFDGGGGVIWVHNMEVYINANAMFRSPNWGGNNGINNTMVNVPVMMGQDPWNPTSYNALQWGLYGQSGTSSTHWDAGMENWSASLWGAYYCAVSGPSLNMNSLFTFNFSASYAGQTCILKCADVWTYAGNSTWQSSSPYVFCTNNLPSSSSTL